MPTCEKVERIILINATKEDHSWRWLDIYPNVKRIDVGNESPLCSHIHRLRLNLMGVVHGCKPLSSSTTTPATTSTEELINLDTSGTLSISTCGKSSQTQMVTPYTEDIICNSTTSIDKCIKAIVAALVMILLSCVGIITGGIRIYRMINDVIIKMT